MSKHCLTLFLAAAIALGGLPARAIAQPTPPSPTPAPAPPDKDKDKPVGTGPTDKAAGEDDALYNCKRAKRGRKITVSLRPEAELKDLITWVMGFTCKNFIYEPGLVQRAKKVTIVSPVEMTPQEAYRLFLVAMSTMGVTVVPKGNALRIVEAGQAKGETVPVYRRGSPGNTDQMVRFIFRPTYMSPDLMNGALNVIKSKDGAVNTVGSVVIVTDYASHVRDMMTMARELDRPSSNEGIYTIRVEYADAKEIAAKVSEILGLQGGGGGGGGAPGGKGGPAGAADGGTGGAPSKILVDERTNTLIVVATEPGYLRVRALVKRLDLPLETSGSGAIHVYPLQYATAEELATTLNAALQGTAQPGRGGTSGTGGTPAGPRAPAPTPQAPSSPVRSDFGSSLEGQVRVTHDAPTNSLVVVASGRDFLAVRDVIRKLDTPRQQVYIEAVIMEVQLGNELKLGTSSHGGVPIDGGNGIILGGVQTPDLRSTNLSTLISASGLIGGLIGAPLAESERLLGASIPSYAILFQALATSANTNVLSTPFIMASDNQDAEIVVGQNIPYQAGLSFGGFGLPGQGGQQLPTGAVGQNIQREKLTLTMKIKPHINASDMVRLEIEQEIKDIGDRDPQLGPTWTERRVKTQVSVRDQQSIVIGGLMQDRQIYTEAKVPLLGDIPILGYLFKFTTRTKKKTNLLILLTPYIVKDQIDIQEILERKTRERNEFVRAFANLDSAKYVPRIDYRRKRGLVEEINRSIESVEQDIEVLKSLEGIPAPPDGVIDIGPGQDLSEDPAPVAPPTPSAPGTAPATTPQTAPPPRRAPKRPAAKRPAPKTPAPAATPGDVP